MTAHKIYLYPLWLRSWHWINAILFLILIATGLSMQYTGAAGWLVDANAPKNEEFLFSFRTAVTWHNVAGLLLTLNYLFYLICNLLTPNGKYYKIQKKELLKRLYLQGRFYAYGIFKGEKHPFPVTEKDKFNPLQKVSYVLVMFGAMPLLILSGFGLLFPEIVADRIFNVSGLVINDLIHITMGFILSLFLVIHVYICTLGVKPSTLFKSMINGYHETDH